MKTHAIIPIFIPHRGCPHDCVFCNQRRITARSGDVTPEDARAIIETWLSTLRPLSAAADGADREADGVNQEARKGGANAGGVRTVEVSFYGGSFTGLPLAEQSAFLAVAKEYKDAGRIDKVHLSTRPDYIDREILDNLRAYTVDTVELGVQSFDDDVLRASGRGHDSRAVYQAVALLKEYGFEFGIQLMIGLPGDSPESCVRSARETAALGPALARLYPTVVLPDTALYDMRCRGEYTPLTLEESVSRTLAMYKVLDAAGINILRVGLKSSDLVSGDTYHPAFRQLVEGALARERIVPLLDQAQASVQSAAHSVDASTATKSDPQPQVTVTLYSNHHWFSNMIGHKAENKHFFADRYPQLSIRYAADDTLPGGWFRAAVTRP